jgi:protein-tyrosine-phosphatase
MEGRMNNRKSVVFVSDKNICRSIIAEVVLRKIGKGKIDVHSFGLSSDKINFLVEKFLKEKGYNLNYSFSKRFEVIENQHFDVVVLMYPSLEEKMPKVPYNHHLIIWEYEDLKLENTDDAEKNKRIEKLYNDLTTRIENEHKIWLN